MPPPSPDTAPRGPRCTLCGAPAMREQLPFCSPRCRDRDLLAWLGDGYRVPGDASEDGTSSLDITADRD